MLLHRKNLPLHCCSLVGVSKTVDPRHDASVESEMQLKSPDGADTKAESWPDAWGKEATNKTEKICSVHKFEELGISKKTKHASKQATTV